MGRGEGASHLKKSSTTAKVTLQPSPDCCSRCCRGSIYRARCFAGATWPLLPLWSTTVCRSMSRRWSACAPVGPAIQDQLIAAIDRDYGVYDGRTFKLDRFAKYLAAAGIPWPLLESGQLDLSDDTFRQVARAYPQIAPLRELRSSLAELRLNDLRVGRDGRNRTILSAFRSRTGRNQPSNAKFIFGPSVWLRGLIKPPPGQAVAYVDWKQQEFGIAAALSGDTAMQAAYRSGDPYLAFAKQAVPFRTAPPRQRTAHSASYSSSASWRCSTACRQTGWRYVLRNHASLHATCCQTTTKPIRPAGAGQTPRSTLRC